MDYSMTTYPKGYTFGRLLSSRTEFCITHKYTLAGTDLPGGYSYEIWVTDGGTAITRSRRQSTHSTRWSHFHDLMVGDAVIKTAEQQAMSSGMRWACRQSHSDLVVKCAKRAGEDTTLNGQALRDHIDTLSSGELATTVMDKAVDLALSYRWAKTRRITA